MKGHKKGGTEIEDARMERGISKNTTKVGKRK